MITILDAVCVCVYFNITIISNEMVAYTWRIFHDDSEANSDWLAFSSSADLTKSLWEIIWHMFIVLRTVAGSSAGINFFLDIWFSLNKYRVNCNKFNGFVLLLCQEHSRWKSILTDHVPTAIPTSPALSFTLVLSIFFLHNVFFYHLHIVFQ